MQEEFKKDITEQQQKGSSLSETAFYYTFM